MNTIFVWLLVIHSQTAVTISPPLASWEECNRLRESVVESTFTSEQDYTDYRCVSAHIVDEHVKEK